MSTAREDWVADTTLDLGLVGAVDAHLMRQRLRREPALDPQRPNPDGERLAAFVEQ